MDIFSILDLAVNVIILLITIYGVILRYLSNNFQLIDIKRQVSRYGPEYLTITLKNRTLRDVYVNKINIIIDLKYRIELKKCEDLMLIGPLETKIIKSDSFSYIGGKFVELDESYIKSKLSKENCKVELVLASGKKIYSSFKELSWWSNWKTRTFIRKNQLRIKSV